MLYKTPFRKSKAGTFVRAEFGLCALGEQSAYCTLTGDEYARMPATGRNCIAVGQLHELLHECFPELDVFARWHMCTDGVPMHYVANAKYWYEVANNLRMQTDFAECVKARSYFAKTVLLGVLDTDPSGDDGIMATLALDWPEVQTLLEIREVMLRKAFKTQIVDVLPELARQLDATTAEG